MYNISSASAEEARKRLSRFAQLQPNNPQALYFYAMSLWERDQNLQPNFPQLESLLKKAAALDPNYADAHLQLGILFADQHKYPEATQQFQHAIALQPDLATAHYHVAQCYRRTGEKSRAEEELQIFERLRKQDQLESQKERNEIKQFIVTMKEQASGPSAK
jgi:tetratricopeptide (TPR) repeat protein